MPMLAGVVGYTNQSQQTRLVLEPPANVGEQLLLAQTAGAATMSLTTQPNTLSPTTGMHLHFFIIGNPVSGSVVITGTNVAGGGLVSQTYHVNIAPQNAQGYTEFTTKEAFATVTAASIVLTGLLPCQVIVFGSYAAKILLPMTADAEEKITHHSPADKRGILFKGLRVIQLTKGADVTKFDADLYPDSIWAAYMLFGTTPVLTTVPAAPVSLLASTAKAATMTLTTSLSTVAPGMFLIFTITSNTATGTIVLSGVDNNGFAASETLTATSAASQTLYSAFRYSSITNSGADKFATTGLTSASIAVTAVYAWVRTWTFDGITNVTPYSAGLELYNGVMGVVLPQFIFSDGTFDWGKEKEILFTGKGGAQDYCVVGDPTSTTVGTNPFGTLTQPPSVPMASWPASFYIDAATGTPLTTQDGSLLTFKANFMTGRKYTYAGDGFQRPSFVTWDTPPDFAIDGTMILQNYQNYINYFKTNAPLIMGATFQGSLLGSYSSTTYYESINWTFPVKFDTAHIDFSKSPVELAFKQMSQYDFLNLGYAFKVAWTSQNNPNYTV